MAPRAYFKRTSLNGYEDGDFVSEYRVKRTGAGFDLGYTTGVRSEVRLGYDNADVRARLRIGVPTLPEANGSDSVASLRWVFDGQNSPLMVLETILGPAFLGYSQSLSQGGGRFYLSLAPFLR